MKKIYLILVLISILSCKKKEVLSPEITKEDQSCLDESNFNPTPAKALPTLHKNSKISTESRIAGIYGEIVTASIIEGEKMVFFYSFIDQNRCDWNYNNYENFSCQDNNIGEKIYFEIDQGIEEFFYSGTELSEINLLSGDDGCYNCPGFKSVISGCVRGKKINDIQWVFDVNLAEERFVFSDTVTFGFTPQFHTLKENPFDLSINLKWYDRSDNELGFIIYRGLSESSLVPIDTLSPNVTSYVDTNYNRSTNYYYKVVAYNASISAASLQRSVRTVAGVPILKIISPLNGETFFPNDTINISVEYANISSNFNIQYDLNGNKNWKDVDPNFPYYSSTYQFKIPSFVRSGNILRIKVSGFSFSSEPTPTIVDTVEVIIN